MHLIGFRIFTSAWLYFLEHYISNWNCLVYLMGIILLIVDASNLGDAQGWSELAIYTIMFPLLVYIVELTSGVKAIQALDRTYPYDDSLLVPSIFYDFGMEHRLRKRIQEDSELEDFNLPTESDPTAEEDAPLDDFFLFAV